MACLDLWDIRIIPNTSAFHTRTNNQRIYHGDHYTCNVLVVCSPAVTLCHPTNLWILDSESPAAARTVELLGSWDNFAKSYSMKRDIRKGSCFWSGCYSFKDIICDGDLNNLGQKRSGGLKMGGTYWYYVSIPGQLLI